VHFRSTVGAGEAGVFKHLVDFWVRFFIGQLTGMKITVFFGITAAGFSHILPPDYWVFVFRLGSL